MSFPDSNAIARIECTRDQVLEWTHHPECPQHPHNDVLEPREECECIELVEADRLDMAEARADARREG